MRTGAAGALVAVAVFCLFHTPPASAATVTSSVLLPIEGEVHVPSTGEAVAISGLVHVVTQVINGSSLKVDASLEETLGAGGNSSVSYRAVGTDQIGMHIFPPNPIAPFFFTLWPPDPNFPPVPVRFLVDLQFSDTGELLVGEVVDVSITDRDGAPSP